MKLTHISPEFNYNNVQGTLSMSEKKSFFSSKLIKFDSNIEIKNESIVYYQNNNNEQINLNNELLLGPVIYDTSNDKKINHSLVLDNSQTNIQLNNNTAWILTIDYGLIFKNYLFATLKKWRTFEGITNNLTLNNDINFSIESYIKENLIDRYQLEKIDLFISYNDVLTNNPPLLLKNNVFDSNVSSEDNLVKKYNATKDNNKMNIRLFFNQDKTSLEYNFNYYYNIYFTKV